MYVIIVKGLFMNNIYIDVLITVNIFIDYFLLMLTKKIIGSNIKYFRVIIGSIVGGLFSLTALLPVVRIKYSHRFGGRYVNNFYYLWKMQN